MLTPPQTTGNAPDAVGAPRVAIAALTLLGGAAIYVAARPMQLRWTTWIEALGLGGTLDAVRDWTRPMRGALPEWCVYSLPDGLWLFSLLTALDCVWGGAGRPPAIVRGAALVAALAHEAAQARWGRLGTFCWADVACYAAAWGAASGLDHCAPRVRWWR